MYNISRVGPDIILCGSLLRLILSNYASVSVAVYVYEVTRSDFVQRRGVGIIFKPYGTYTDFIKCRVNFPLKKIELTLCRGKNNLNSLIQRNISIYAVVIVCYSIEKTYYIERYSLSYK